MSGGSLDVAILGGGLAGNLLARQLRRARPELRVGLFEQSTGTSYKVGEATVEIAANYLTRRLGLTRYLYEQHLPKNGLRYFFDDAERSLPLERMSEIGSVNLPFHPAFQIDRARMEADLLEANRADGADVRRGARIVDVALGEGGAPHAFEVEDARGRERWSSRWLVDACGRSGLLARPLGLRLPEAEHRLGSVWGRFEGVADVDDLGPESFRARVRHTSRRLSTIHFWYPGYWIWFIPLRGGLTSVGVTGACVAERRALRTPEGFRAFLDEHRAIGGLLAGAKMVDVGSLARIAYGTRRFVHPDRWALVGEAANSTDPLYSPGSDFIALENDIVTDLVSRDAAGEPPEELAERCELQDAFLRFRHRATILLYEGLYDSLGSFELACPKWDFDIGCYYNLWTASYLCDEHLDADALREQLRLEPFVLQALRNFAVLFRKVDRRLREQGAYHRGNADRFRHGLEGIPHSEEAGLPRSQSLVLERAADTFNRVRADALALLGEESGEPRPITSFLTRRALA